MTPELRELLSTFPLPDGWSSLEVVEDSCLADGVDILRAGVASVGPEGEEITGSAADTKGCPGARSYFELLERVSTVEALGTKQGGYKLRTLEGDLAGHTAASDVFPDTEDPSRWRYARSNGVALHADWRTACTRASWELAERDRILRCWYGETRPERLALPVGGPLGGARTYDLRAYAFPEPDTVRFSHGLDVVGVFGFPRIKDAPLLMGFAARPGTSQAFDAAAREALQLLAFLWGEPTPNAEPPVGPTAGHHLDHFQWQGNHEILLRWLEGGHRHYRGDGPTRPDSDVAFIDLTPLWLGGGLRVAKAICDCAVPLTFGDSPLGRHLPVELQTHPIA